MVSADVSWIKEPLRGQGGRRRVCLCDEKAGGECGTRPTQPKLPTRACLARREGKCERNGKGREVVAGLGVARASQ